MRNYLKTAISFIACLVLSWSFAVTSHESLPVIKLVKISDNVYSAIGDTKPPSYDNWGHNNNLSVVIGEKKVLVVNGSDNFLLAKSLHQAIKKLTNKPVAYIVNENGQGHAMLGNSYWRSLKIPIIASLDASKEFEEDSHAILKRMLERNKERGKGTSIALPDITFEDYYKLELGNTPVELISFGPAHSAGDISVWLPNQQIIIAGDIAFHQRLLAIFPETNTKQWLSSFEKMMALKPKFVIPGHGEPTDIQTIKKFTYDYLVFLRSKVAELLDEDLGLTEAYQIDQSAYSQLDTFNELATKNAGRVFQEMEMEDF